ncbi:MAG: hypothetical protein ACRDN0_31460 [Trebonia sp.]
MLIVEDDPYVRSAMAAELTTRAHAVRTAARLLTESGRSVTIRPKSSSSTSASRTWMAARP